MTIVGGFRYPGVWSGDTSAWPIITGSSTDPLLVNGSMMLIDPSSTEVPWPSGVPADGATLRINLAWDRLSDLIGSGNAADLGVRFFNTLTPSTEAIFERTAKGGLHGIVSQVNSGSGSRFAALQATDALLAYMFANSGHDYYMAVTEMVTRSPLASSPIMGVYSGAPNTSNFFGYTQISSGLVASVGPTTPAPPYINSRITGGYALTTPSNIGLTRRGFTGTLPGAASGLGGYFAVWGNAGSYASLTRNKAMSKVFYGFYMENLTVSGRSHATVDALVAARFSAQFASGGAFNGDTYTAPSTLA